MRLHHLTVTGFGPFADSVEVDFDDVSAAGLFLIHGATGSGKTSLLDAICFALFADVPGARTRKGLSSHHAPEGTQPVVRLDFSAGGRRFRIQRSPDFERPKTRGSGLRRMPAQVTLEERAGGRWAGVSTRHDEVADVLHDVLNMGLQQFAKVVVLPQGDVSAFLRSSPEDRRALLEKLFDITTFTDVESWLAEERRRTATEVASAVGLIEADLDRLDALLRDSLVDSEDTSWRSVPLAEVPARLDTSWSALQDEVGSLLTAADEAELACGLASAALAEARSLVAARDRGARAQSVIVAAEEQTEEIAALRTTIRRARDAEAVSGHLAGVKAAERDVAGARAAAGLTSAADLDETAQAGAAASLERLQSAEPVLDLLAGAGSDARHSMAALERARAAHVAAEAAVPQAREQAADARDRHDSAVIERQRLAAVAAGVEAAEERATAAERRLTTATQVADLCSGRDEATPAIISANEALLRAQESLVALRTRQLDGMAGTLAATLTAGDPCPVCGSTEHPAIASSTDLVTEDEIAHAESEHTAALALVTDLRAQESAVNARIETLCEQLGGTVDELDLDLLAADLDMTTTVLAEARDAARLLPAAVTEESAAAAALGVAVQAETSAEVSLETTSAALAAATDEMAAREHRLQELIIEHAEVCGCQPHEDVDTSAVDATSAEAADAVLACHRATQDRAELLVAALEAHEAATARLTERTAAAVEAATERGFATLDEVRSAAVPEHELATLRAQLSDHDQALAVASATLAEEGVVAALGADPPDIAAATAAESLARRRLREAQSAHTAAESRLTQLGGLRTSLTAAIESVAGVRERAEAVKDLGDAVNGTGGGNELRMRLSSFVLAARLEKVVALANERLQTMDAGRYLLEHSDARVSGGARGGLDLRVLDQWTGRTRETASLSGGESFMVSLALALGLADAVREESGGFDLGTLFVDEGFGSLDEDALEHVMGVLDGLREGGRAVGVVSHVPELRTRITHQVVVDKSTTGSTVRTQTASVPAA